MLTIHINPFKIKKFADDFVNYHCSFIGLNVSHCRVSGLFCKLVSEKKRFWDNMFVIVRPNCMEPWRTFTL